MLYSDGTLYEGWFKDNTRSIRGRMIRNDGGLSEYELIDNSLFGKGTLRWLYGYEYFGEFKEGK